MNIPPSNRGVLEDFQTQAILRPDAPALQCGSEVLSYSELNRRANQFAYFLMDRGAKPETLVAVAVERSVAAVVAILGIWKAGAAYLPLDNTWPEQRVEAILNDAQVSLAVGECSSAGRNTEAVGLNLNREEIARKPGWNPEISIHPESLAYVIYTSGSTGQPKGVAIAHAQLSHYCGAILQLLAAKANDRFALVSALAADLGYTMLFPALAVGGCLHLVPEEAVRDPRRFAREFKQTGIDFLKITPAHFHALCEGAEPSVFPRKGLVFGGEALGHEWVEAFRRTTPGLRIFNHYGPTECTVGAIARMLDGTEARTVSHTAPLGFPLGEITAIVLNEDMRPTSPGTEGELCLGGPCVGRGYLGKPALSAERFIGDPYSARPGARLYQTGDLARALPDGSIEFAGRIDDQVKIRGYRVELGEIEAAVRRLPAVESTVVFAREDGHGGKQLVAYVALKKGRERNARKMQHALTLRLPSYMIPSAWVFLDRLPLNGNGKIDRLALPLAPLAKASLGTAERNEAETEAIVRKIWSGVLRVPDGSSDCDFFDAGGDSLSAMRIIARTNAAFQTELEVNEIFEYQSIRDFARRVDAAVASSLFNRFE